MALYRIRIQNPGLFGQGQNTLCQILKGRIHGFGPGHHHNVPAGLELGFIQAVNLPKTAAGTVADVGLAQLLTDGDANTVVFRAVTPCVKHKIAVSNTLAVIQPLKNVIQFQRA